MSGRSRLRFFSLAAMLALIVPSLLARVDVKVEWDKTLDFKPFHTWAWNPKGHGDVIMARTAEDDPDVAKKRAEPIIVDAVSTEMGNRGMKPATGGPDVIVTYYLLLTLNVGSQTMGQFLPATTAWGLPPFPPATQALNTMNYGSLVLDLSVKGNVVWRGVAQAKVSFDADDKKREALLREAVRDLLKKYPPKP